jgi:ribosome-associated protein
LAPGDKPLSDAAESEPAGADVGGADVVGADLSSATVAGATLAQVLARAALGGKAEAMVLLDVSVLSSLTDFYLIATGTSDRHVRALADRIAEAGREAGTRVRHREGEREGRWVLLDFGDVVVHLFDPPTREFYDIVQLWADAPRLEVEPEPDDEVEPAP